LVSRLGGIIYWVSRSLSQFFFSKEDLMDLLCSFLQILQVLYFQFAASKMISNDLSRCRF
jgi:hypothetical protein